MSAPTNRPRFVYVIYIASTPERVFAALTEPEMTERYWFGFRIAANGKAGSSFTMRPPGGDNVEKGVILESDPPRRLSYTWYPKYEDDKHERPSRVAFDIEPLKGQVRLTIVHEDFDEGSKMFEGISKGWPAVLSSLKSFLETGRALESTLNSAPATAGPQS
jgi:uncharacterized protein YndB with AHSA1/START domain